MNTTNLNNIFQNPQNAEIKIAEFRAAGGSLAELQRIYSEALQNPARQLGGVSDSR